MRIYIKQKEKRKRGKSKKFPIMEILIYTSLTEQF